MYRGLTTLAVVPARGGSKGIPKKNLRIVAGRSLIAHVGEIVRAVPWIDQAVVSTDDGNIAKEARAHNLDVPFSRPAGLARDDVDSVDVWRHAWLEAENHYGIRFDVSILLEPTSPMRVAQDLTSTISALVEGGHGAAATISRHPTQFSPHKTLTVDDGRLGFFLPEGARFSQRQRIPAFYHRNGVCYAATRRTVVDTSSLFEDCVGVLIEHPTVNIDDDFELSLAEWLIRRSGGTSV